MEENKSTQQYQYRQNTTQQANVQYAAKASEAEGLVCPKCGAVNDSNAAFCEECGTPLGSRKCPVCGAELVPGADVCENCHSFISSDTCSFCGALMMEGAQFCNECGNPRGGIECPSCHTRSPYSFCPKCGMALTQSARYQRQKFMQTSQYLEMAKLAEEYEKLLLKNPVDDETQKAMFKKAEDIKNRFYALSSLPMPTKTDVKGQMLSSEDLQAALEKKRQELQQALDLVALPAEKTAAQARMNANVCRPPLSRLGWKCNFRSEIHHGPEECACPQMGGKWLVKENGKEKEV